MDAFYQQRIWQRAHRLSLAQLTCLGRHTLSGLICTNGRQFQDWSGDYRVFAKDHWDLQQLFKPIISEVLKLSNPNMPFVTALDDTHLKKTGRHIPGVGYGRDPLSPPFHCNLIRVQRFIQLSAMLCGHAIPTGAQAIPIQFKHAPPIPKPKKTESKEVWKAYRKARREKNLSTYGADIIKSCRQQLDRQHDNRDRLLVVAVDGSYCNKHVLRDLPPRTTLIGRIRKDAKLCYPPTEGDQPRVGSKRKYGPPAPTPEQLRKDSSIPWQEVRAYASGKVHTFQVKTLKTVLWSKAGPGKPLRQLVIAPVGYRLRKGSKLLYHKPAYLICTDRDLPLEEVLQYYIWRWEIEVNHRDEKQIIGVGQAQVRSVESVERHPAFAVASYAMLLLASARAFGTEQSETALPVPKWQRGRTRTRIGTQKLIEQLRQEVWHFALDQCRMHSRDFGSARRRGTKCPKLDLPLSSAVLYCQN